MKTMKQISAFFLAIVMALSLAACGGAEKTVVLTKDMTADMGGIPTTDTFTLTAKGDVITTLKEVYELDFSDTDDALAEYYISMFDLLILEPAKGIDGLTCTSRTSDKVYTIEMTVNFSGDTVKEAVEAGILGIEGDSGNKYSLKKTQASFEQQGYKVVE